jgi:hypothetical protein
LSEFLALAKVSVRQQAGYENQNRKAGPQWLFRFVTEAATDDQRSPDAEASNHKPMQRAFMRAPTPK